MFGIGGKEAMGVYIYILAKTWAGPPKLETYTCQFHRKMEVSHAARALSMDRILSELDPSICFI